MAKVTFSVEVNDEQIRQTSLEEWNSVFEQSEMVTFQTYEEVAVAVAYAWLATGSDYGIVGNEMNVDVDGAETELR